MLSQRPKGSTRAWGGLPCCHAPNGGPRLGQPKRWKAEATDGNGDPGNWVGWAFWNIFARRIRDETRSVFRWLSRLALTLKIHHGISMVPACYNLFQTIFWKWNTPASRYPDPDQGMKLWKCSKEKKIEKASETFTVTLCHIMSHCQRFGICPYQLLAESRTHLTLLGLVVRKRSMRHLDDTPMFNFPWTQEHFLVTHGQINVTHND